MSKDMLLEIGVEEIPSAYMSRVLEDIKNTAAAKMDKANLEYSEVFSYGTPRRLTLFIKGLNEKQKDLLIENKGPKKEIGFNSDGEPTKAGLGFARSQGVEIKDLEIREISGTNYLFAVKKEKGRKTEDILPTVLEDIIKSLSFPKSMRWAYYDTRFARPIRWLLAIYGYKTIRFKIENIESSNYTFGHRFLSSGPIAVKDTSDYFKVLAKNYVILDHNERKNLIRKQVVFIAESVDGRIMENEELLEEITHLLEYPTAFMGGFSRSYLEVPAEVLTTSMIEHQRYFPVFDADKKLLPKFIGVRNGTEDNIDLVIDGNEKVLKARLEDALFFWNEDTKKSLEEMAVNLKNVLFHERLGTIMDKVERLQKLSGLISHETNMGYQQKLQQAAYLCKADLLSNMVYEFPELQGIMGRYYAVKSGEDPEVSDAIYEHYLPRFAGDDLPFSDIGRVLSLAEKIDNIVGCFSIGIKPTGSQDPYALRRQAMGIVHIILASGLRINLKNVLKEAYDGFVSIEPDINRDDTVSDVMDFILQRMRGILLEKGMAYDVIDSVLNQPNYDLNNIIKRIEIVQDFKKTKMFEDFIVVYNRANNLSKGWNKETVDEKLLVDASEKQLYQIISSVRDEVQKALIKEDYQEILKALTGLRPKIDNFFESVMVMVEKEELKANRLSILKTIANLCNSVTDFNKIVQ